MGKVKYATGIEYVNGSLAKPTVKAGHKHGTYLIGTHRTAPTENPNCTRLYVRNQDVYERTGEPTANEILARARFTAVSRMIKTRKADLLKITADQEAFLAQKDTAGGKKTMKAWYWMVCGEEYDAQQNG
jgi:hypothetical protein